MIIKKLDLFKKKPDNAKNSHANLGFYTIDFKLKVVYQTSDPANIREYYKFAEGPTKERERSYPSRLINNIAEESLKHGNKGEFNKLGMDWY